MVGQMFGQMVGQVDFRKERLSDRWIADRYIRKAVWIDNWIDECMDKQIVG